MSFEKILDRNSQVRFHKRMVAIGRQKVSVQDVLHGLVFSHC